jgi:hypothetical protein
MIPLACLVVCYAPSIQPPSPQEFLRSDGSTIIMGQNPLTLGTALQRFHEELATRAPLILVAPQTIFQGELPPSLSLGELLEAAERRLVRVGRLNALVPLNIRTLAPHELDEQETEEQAWLGLMASLSDFQWQKLLGAQGLGFSDVSAQQARKLERVLPKSITIVSRKRLPNGGVLYTGSDPKTTLTEQQRQQVRLQIRREVQWSFYHVDNKNGTQGFGVNRPTPALPVAHALESDPKVMVRQDGVHLVPNTRKPSDLNYRSKALEVSVSLKNANTIDELVTRVAAATRVELYADRRYGKLPVQCWGESASAADVLEAIAFSVGGTFRRVSDGTTTLYILTCDQEGLDSHRARRTALATRRNLLGQEAFLPLFQTIKKRKPEQWLAFSPNDPYKLTPELLQKMAPKRDRSRATLPVAELPESIQTEIQRQLKESVKYANQAPLNTKEVAMDTNLKLSYLVPDFGALDNPRGLGYPIADALLASADAYQLPPPPLKRPLAETLATWQKKIALVAPRTSDEAALLAKKASEVGMTELWLDVPAAPEKAQALLQAARAATKLPVGALVRPSHPKTEDVVPGLAPGLTILLETEPAWMKHFQGITGPTLKNLTRPYAFGSTMLDLDRATRDVLGRQLAALAQTPGLAGLALSDYLPPGYARSATIEMGYTPARRIAFIRQEKLDPVDLPPGNSYGSGGDNSNPSFFWDTTLQAQRPRLPDDPPAAEGDILRNLMPNKDSPVVHWREARKAEGIEALRAWQAGIRQAAPQLPLWISQTPDYLTVIYPWEDTLTLAKTWERVGMRPSALKLPEPMLSAVAPNLFLGLPFWPKTLEDAAQQGLISKPKPGGAVFNFTELTTREALDYLAVLK